MLSTILSWLAGGGISAIGEQINRWQSIKAKAQNDHERLEADKMLAELEAKRTILLAEQSSWMTRWVRPAIAFPLVAYLWKLIIFDKILGLGTTDDLSPELWKLFWIVIGAYFVTRPLEKFVRR